MDFSYNMEQNLLDTSILDEFLTPNIIEDINNGMDLGNDPDFDKILNMLNDNDVKDPLEELNCDYYYPTNNNTPSSTSSDSGRFSPTSIDSHDFPSNYSSTHKNSSPIFYNQEFIPRNLNTSPSCSLEYNNLEYVPSPSTTNVSYISQNMGNSCESTSLTLPSQQSSNMDNINKPIHQTNTKTISNVVLLNPVKIVQPATIQLQPIQILPQQQQQVCFVLEDSNLQPQHVTGNTLNFTKTTSKPQNKELFINKNSSRLVSNQMGVGESNSILLNNIDECESEFIRKREERKAKNRMAAHISRQRKKTEFNELQNKLKLVEEENIFLKEENMRLKNRILDLEKENNSLRCPSEYKPYPKKAKLGAFTAVCMIGLICTFQFTSVFENQHTNMPLPATNVKALTTQQKGLTMKEITSNENYLLKKFGRSLSVKNNTKDLHLIKNTVSSLNQTKYANCSQFVISDLKVFHLNESAKNKINDELSFWFDKHEKIYDNDDSVYFGGIKNYRKNIYNGILNSGKSMKKKVKKVIMEKEKNYPLSLPKIVKKNILNTLVEAMKRRNDTIYIMPKKNYYLLPAIKRDNNTVPKMSILIPSERISNLKTKSEITMLRIECEIVGTEYFNVPKSLFNFEAVNDGIPGFI
uniref:BZIP domain-containing protein n=1 Tax=Strongyloides venezuelensis TaxID=75913 RepID=A0A0K0FK46_STRVS